MTDRAQPGAIDSIIRNDELAQILGQLTGGFDDGWVADPADPTPASTRRSDINESAFDGFALSNVSASSLSVDVGPGEAFAGGWFARDTSTTVSLPTNTTSTIVAAMDIDAVYDPNSDPDRDAADKVVIDLAANVSDDLPRVQLHNVTTDGSGVTGTTDLRKPYGPALKADSGTVGTLEASDSFTDPAGIPYDGAINPVQVTEEASTFTESDVTVTNSGTLIKSGSIELGISDTFQTVDDFESGDLIVENEDWADWSDDTGNLSAQQSTVLSGSRSGEFTADNDNTSIKTARDSDIKASSFELLLEIDNDTGNSDDQVIVDIYDSSGNLILDVGFVHGSNNIEVRLSDTGTDWSPNTTHTLTFDNIDYNNETLDVKIDGSTIASDEDIFSSLVDGLGELEIQSISSNSGQTVNTYVDDIKSAEKPATSGDALVEWDSAVPTDIDSYDLATFQRTLDSETVTIDVEDGNSNVLFSDISQNFDISTVDTSKEVKLRANLSRNNTSNNPTIDYLARRFNRS